MSNKASRRRAKSTVDTESYMDWRAQSGLDKQGDEKTVDDWSDEEGPVDTYENRRLRKDVTNLIHDDAELLQGKLQEYFQRIYATIHIANPKSSSDGNYYYGVTGISNINDFMNTVDNSDFDVTVFASHEDGYSTAGIPTTSHNLAIVYNPQDLVGDYFSARYYARKTFFSLGLFVTGAFLVYMAWSDISRYFYVSDIVISTLLVAVPICIFLGTWRQAFFAALWVMLFMTQCQSSGVPSLLPPSWDFSLVSLRYWASDCILAIATVIALTPFYNRAVVPCLTVADNESSANIPNRTWSKKKKRKESQRSSQKH